MLTLLCVDSNLQHLAQIKQDLLPLTARLSIITADNIHNAERLIFSNNYNIAIIICAQSLSDGGALSLFKCSQCNSMRKIIYAENPSCKFLTECINRGQINYFLTFPYQAKDLTQLVQTQMSNYKISHRQRKQSKNNIVDKTCLLNNPELSAQSNFQDKFLDYSLYSDSELSNLVIKSLYAILEAKDEHNVRRCYSANHLLTREGDRNNFLWFITKGEVLLKKRNAQGEMQSITCMQAGTMIGGMSFLTGEPAFSTGITLMKTEVLKVDNAIFSQIMQSNSALLAPFTNLLLRNFNRRLQHSISTELALQETLQSLDAAHGQLVESEKMAVLGQLVAGVAHELNNPVAAILRGTETLSSLISTLLSHEKQGEFSQLAHKTLQQGLTINALSTSEIRQRTKALQETIKDKKQAKRLVNMNLDAINIPLENNRNLEESITLLSHYHQAGTLLRNSNTCAARIADLVKSLKHYAGEDAEKFVATNIHDGIEETLIIFENKLKHYNLIKEYQQLPKIDCHPIKLEQVWTNIISNAIDATGNQGTLKISTINLPYAETPSVQIIIEDNGPGIPETIRDKIFELNYTSKREGNFGLGIGLTICSQIIKQHNGYIELESEIGEFTRFIITLPVFNIETKGEKATE